jgi:hypothetical protein
MTRRVSDDPDDDGPATTELDAPATYFAPSSWPDGPARPGTPRAVLYAAEFAVFVRAQALARGRNLNAGLRQIQEETHLSSGTLRHIADGRRWPGLQLIAQVEEAFKADATGYSAVLRRIDREDLQSD